ncbi:TetR/AcrR family transcriptional regulator [Angustibacter luteus]|uniref:TetR/AcrR family transcriptional regulator n=1 Tax=Angustibacter luteus TaxID=658456 RepID=A0ABW1JEJ8_9ACTN
MKTPTRRRVPRAEREQQMLEVAEAVFAERGYQATSMDEIATRVGVTKPMLYEYFGSKDGLLTACLARSRQQLHDKTMAAVSAGGEPRAIMLNAVRAFFEFVDDHAAAWAVLQSEAMLNAGPGAAEIEEIRRQQSDYTQALLGSMPGAAQVSPLALQVRAELVTGACERVAIWRSGQEAQVSAQQAADLVMAALWPGLGGETGPGVG